MLDLSPSSGQNWTNAERQELGRLDVACRAAGHWHLEFGRTDEGDPWVTVYDQQDQTVVVHVARIDRRYIAVGPDERRLTWTATLRAAINRAVVEIERLST